VSCAFTSKLISVSLRGRTWWLIRALCSLRRYVRWSCPSNRSFFRLRIIYCWSVSWPDNVITPIPGWMHSRYFKLKSTTFTLPQIWRRELFVSVECKDEMQCLMLESNVMDFGFLERMNTFGQWRVASVEWKRRTHHPYDAKNVLKAKTCWTPREFYEWVTHEVVRNL
jgi:hypothetical protein